MIRPHRLNSGDRIAIVAPASPLPASELDAAVDELRSLGFDAVYDTRVLASTGYVAGDPALRADLLTEAWRDRSVKAIVAARGGYGSMQVLPLLDPREAVAARKPLVGYSDITALLNWHLAAGLVCFHGPMADRRLAAGEATYDRASLMAAVTRAEPMGTLAPAGVETLKAGRATGVLVGGTISMLAASLGTPWAFDPPEGAVLFLEDVGERPYRVDRLLTQLAQAGILDRAAAIVFGMFPGCEEPRGPATVRDVALRVARGCRGPVLFGFPSGHGTGAMLTLPFGVRATVTSGPVPAIDIEEAAVS